MVIVLTLIEQSLLAHCESGIHALKKESRSYGVSNIFISQNITYVLSSSFYKSDHK